MNVRALIGLITCMLFLSMSACTRVKSYFPDKAKDYQLTTEIPSLNVPADLSDHTIEAAPKARAYQGNAEINQGEVINSHQVVQTETVEIEKEPLIYVELIEYSGGATRIRIEESMEIIWRTVGKALSRHSIEILDRNEIDRVYSVQYDANFKKIKDESVWDEMVFIFGSDPAKEEEFRLKLVEYGGFIEVLVLDQDDIPLSQGNGLKLLKTLYNTIKQDLAD